MSKRVTGKAQFRNQHGSKPDPTRGRTKAALRELDVVPRKARGQNFIVNDLVISSIVDFGRPSRDEYVVEIGPGLGALTRALLPFDLKAVIEFEPAFAREIASAHPGIQVFEADARSFDYCSFKTPITLFANLPYSISSEMLIALCDAPAGVVRRAVLMLQREFAERLAEPVGGSNYGILSVYCQQVAALTLGPIVEAEHFHPRPKIDSQLIELAFKTERAQIVPAAWFRRVVRAAFSKRRKKLSNSLLASGLTTALEVEKALQTAGVDGNKRAQELSFEDYERLAVALKAHERYANM